MNNDLVCMPGAKVSQVRMEIFDLFERKEINKLVLHAGGKNIPNEPPQLRIEIGDMLRALRVDSPDMQIFYSAILPKMHPCLLPAINEFNRLVFDACCDLGVKFINHNAFAIRGGI